MTSDYGSVNYGNANSKMAFISLLVKVLICRQNNLSVRRDIHGGPTVATINKYVGVSMVLYTVIFYNVQLFTDIILLNACTVPIK